MKYEQPKLASLLMRTEMACTGPGSSASAPSASCSSGGDFGTVTCTNGFGAIACNALGSAVISLECTVGSGDGVACSSGAIADGFAPGAKG